MTVQFAGLPAGVYSTHLHTICNGSQGFHLGVLQSLVVHADHTGSITVPAEDLNRGWCLIVYSDRSLSRVLTVRNV